MDGKPAVGAPRAIVLFGNDRIATVTIIQVAGRGKLQLLRVLGDAAAKLAGFRLPGRFNW